MPKGHQLMDRGPNTLKAIVQAFTTKVATLVLLMLLALSIIANIIFSVREVRHQRKLKVLRESLALGVLVKDET
jgi:hypothetical protein